MSGSRSTASKCCRRKARTSRRSIDREWHFTTWVISTRPSTTWKRQDPASRQVWGREQGCGFALSAFVFLSMRGLMSLTWLHWFPQGWACMTHCMSLPGLPFKHSWVVQQGHSAQRLTAAKAAAWPGRWQCCWNAVGVEGILPLFSSLTYIWVRKQGGERVYPNHYIFWLCGKKLLPLSNARRLSSSVAFCHLSKGLVFCFDQGDRHLPTKHSSGCFNFCREISQFLVKYLSSICQNYTVHLGTAVKLHIQTTEPCQSNHLPANLLSLRRWVKGQSWGWGRDDAFIFQKS